MSWLQMLLQTCWEIPVPAPSLVFCRAFCCFAAGRWRMLLIRRISTDRHPPLQVLAACRTAWNPTLRLLSVCSPLFVLPHLPSHFTLCEAFLFFLCEAFTLYLHSVPVPSHFTLCETFLSFLHAFTLAWCHPIEYRSTRQKNRNTEGYLKNF